MKQPLQRGQAMAWHYTNANSKYICMNAHTHTYIYKKVVGFRQAGGKDTTAALQYLFKYNENSE